MEQQKIILTNLFNSKLYICKTKGSYSQISLIIKSGANEDPYNRSGLAHFTEHVCLSYKKLKSEDLFKNEINKYIFSKNFTFTGHTDFDHTVLNIVTKNNLINIKESILIIKNILQGRLIKEYIIEEVKDDIELECKQNEWITNKNKKIISFITNNNLNNMPIGNIDDIYSINKKDIEKYLFENYTMNNAAIVVLAGIDKNVVINYTYRILKQLFRGQYSRINLNKKPQVALKSSSDILFLNEKNCKEVNINIFFNYYTDSVDDEYKFILFIIEQLLLKRLCKNRGNFFIIDFKISYKFVRKDFDFIVMTFKVGDVVKISKKDIYKIIINIMKINFTLEDVMQVINIFGDEIFLSTDVNRGDKDLFESVKNNFLYGDKITYIDEMRNYIKNISKEIFITKINKFKNRIFTNNYKAVIIGE